MKMNDHITSPAQQAAVPTEDVPAPQHGTREHEHDHNHGTHQHVTNHETSIHENSEKVMAAFHDKMMALAEENTAQSATEAHEIAHLLLEHAELPLAIRARAHIVLSSGKTNYLHHAQEAVRIAQKGRDIFGPGSTPEAKAAGKKKAGTLKLKKGEKLLYGNINDDETDRIADMPTVATSGTQDHVPSDGETDEEDAVNKGKGLDAKEDNANKSKKEATPADEVNEEEVSTEEEVNEDEVFTEEEPHMDRKYFKGISGPTSPIVTPRP
ncbi:hypothetical protein M438DRAFT_331438 [Aureobasidium pullulans EXF-150]|uniref:Uncharacterized protein n=1 Tax=Aureobasidium pullulans EXF-150 TaxID=1043002 RepID=A0A074Y2V5_AURPU|nr:uncharacterized protein M438DRAFT_331438 [Aureobasidium pullulans EXF-150]KEQ88532.1 hypothetical protein M438DRAFT_331438 [Aureobasidium pullulans EXF-150]